MLRGKLIIYPKANDFNELLLFMSKLELISENFQHFIQRNLPPATYIKPDKMVKGPPEHRQIVQNKFSSTK